jgi:hypothetical protein
MSKRLTEATTADVKQEFGQISAPKPIQFRHVNDIVLEQREPEWLLHKVIEAKVLAVLAGPRGTFKSFIALDWAMRMAMEGHSGVILSGEGAGLDRRIAAWMNEHRESTDLATVPLVAIERPINLYSPLELEALREATAKLPKSPAFVVIDTLSKFTAGLDENDNSEVAGFLGALSSVLRDELGCTVLLVAHSGHGNSGRPRGASSLMANPDAEYIVDRPDMTGMMVTVTRERFKDAPSMPPLAYEAQVIDLGRLDRYGEPVTSLALVSSSAPPPALNAKGRGRNQEKFAVALREWHRANPDATGISTDDMVSLLAAQGMKDRRRRREVLDSFVNAKVLTHSVAGYTINFEHL